MSYKVVIFDLDGTLLDTLEDLTKSVNTLLTRYSFTNHSREIISTFIGHGAPYLLKNSLPLEHQDRSEEYMDEFIEIYKAQNTHTSLYSEMDNVLDFLTKQGVKLGLFTNKPKAPTEACLTSYLKHWTFFPAISQTLNAPVKPDPQGIFDILKAHSCSPEESVYIGDSEVDIETARNAGVESIGVSWGFRTVAQLKNAGASIVLDSPKELLHFFQSAFGNP